MMSAIEDIITIIIPIKRPEISSSNSNICILISSKNVKRKRFKKIIKTDHTSNICFSL